ncbi:MAG: biotin/lipoyl-containing protein [Bacteroidales bacterium]
MRKLRITVNGTVYDVLVEVLDDEAQAVAEAAAPAVARPASPAASVGSPQPRAAVGRSAGPKHADPNIIAAPIAGTVRDVFVSAGAPMEAKARLVLIEAMKMNTYIYAPRPGIAASVEVQVGDSVHVGDCLVRYEPGGSAGK